MNAFRSLLVMAVLLMATGSGKAHVGMMEIEAVSFAPKTGEADSYVLRCKAVGDGDGERAFTVHLRFGLKGTSPESFREGVRILQERLARGKVLRIGRMSDKGWQPIAGRKSEFESIGLGVHRPKDAKSEDDVVVYFIHDNRF